MKYTVGTYAKALALAIEERGSTEEVAKNFLALVRRNGDEVHLKKIIDEAERLVRIKSGGRMVVVESARPLEASAETMVKKILKAGDRMGTKLTPDLIAGVKITVNDELQFDGSLKGKLDKLFGTIS